ncbi:MAG TPA: FKBP-type peptidyl-prolyl cis-trans isomerase [Candidatus Saccharimonadales bacterium]|nr:FKBP-type peptidyl-prolyl cis-trans isomerase [Candidatus Saccharimonadales bacterium]
MESSTKNWQRIVIWIIAFVLAFGTLGFYFMIILQNNNQQKSLQDVTKQNNEKELPMDPTAYKVDGDVTELQKIDLVEGTGPEAKLGDRLRVHYKGTIAQTGAKFDSSYDRGEPIDFALDELIQGWRDGIPGMKEGGKRRLIVPSELAYGSQGGQGIPPDSDLVFEIELLSVNPPQPAPSE